LVKFDLKKKAVDKEGVIEKGLTGFKQAIHKVWFIKS
jgi:hypothetical protein